MDLYSHTVISLALSLFLKEEFWGKEITECSVFCLDCIKIHTFRRRGTGFRPSSGIKHLVNLQSCTAEKDLFIPLSAVDRRQY